MAKEMNKVLRKAFGHTTYIFFKISRADALAMGLLTCECEHPPNNHFEWDNKSCAFCGCKNYREKSRVGKIVEPVRVRKKKRRG